MAQSPQGRTVRSRCSGARAPLQARVYSCGSLASAGPVRYREYRPAPAVLVCLRLERGLEPATKVLGLLALLFAAEDPLLLEEPPRLQSVAAVEYRGR